MQKKEKLLAKGNEYLKQKDWPRAITTFQQAVKIDPRFAQAWDRLGIALHINKQNIEAIRALRQALALDPKLKDSWLYLGIEFSKSEQCEEAIDAFRKALALDPKDANVWGLLGLELDHNKQYSEAIQAFSRSLSFDSKTVTLWNSLGVVFERLGHLRKAHTVYQRAIALNPQPEDQQWLKRLEAKMNTQGTYVEVRNKSGLPTSYKQSESAPRLNGIIIHEPTKVPEIRLFADTPEGEINVSLREGVFKAFLQKLEAAGIDHLDDFWAEVAHIPDPVSLKNTPIEKWPLVLAADPKWPQELLALRDITPDPEEQFNIAKKFFQWNFIRDH